MRSRIHSLARGAIGLGAVGLLFILPLQAGEDTEDAAVLAGRAALADGFPGVAATQFENALEKASRRRDRAELGLLLMQAWYATGDDAAMLAWMEGHDREVRLDETESAYTLWRARALHRLGRSEQALDVLTYFDRLARDVPLVDQAIRLRGAIHAALGHDDAANEAFRMYDRYFSDRPDAAANLYDWAESLRHQGMLVPAHERLNNLMQRFPDTPEADRAAWRLMKDAVEAEDPAAARTYVNDLLATNRAVAVHLVADAWQVQGWIEEQDGNLSNALAAVSRSTELSTDIETRNRRWVDQARLLMQMHQPDEAIQVLEQAVQAAIDRPDASGLQLSLAHLLAGSGYPARALDAYQNFIEAFPADPAIPDALLGRAHGLARLERWPEVLLACDKVMGLEQAAPMQIADAGMLKGVALATQQNYPDAVAAYQQALALATNVARRAEILTRLAGAHEGLGDLAAAEADYRHILTMAEVAGPEREQALLGAAAMYERNQEWNKALALYQEMMDTFPASDGLPGVLLRRGQLRERLGEVEAAREDYDAVMNRYAGTPWAEQAAMAQLRNAYRDGQDEQVIAAAEAFRTNYPDSTLQVEVDLIRAQLAYDRELYDEAETRYLAIAETYPQHPQADDALYWAGRAAAEQQEFRRAVETYNRLIRDFPDSDLVAEARYAQGDALSEFGEFAGAILAYDEAARAFPNRPLAVRALLRKADCQFALGADKPERYLEAAATYRLVLDREEADTAARSQAEVKLGRTLEKLGRTSEALDTYLNLVYRWLALTEQGETLSDIWFVRAAFHAASLKEAAADTDGALALYRRVADAGVSASEEARRRIEALEAPPREPGAGKISVTTEPTMER